MSGEKESPQTGTPAADPVKASALFDDFAKQAAKTAVWRDAMKPLLPTKKL